MELSIVCHGDPKHPRKEPPSWHWHVDPCQPIPQVGEVIYLGREAWIVEERTFSYDDESGRLSRVALWVDVKATHRVP